MKTENAGYCRWRTPRHLEWQQHCFFIAAKGSEWKLKIQTQGTNNTLYSPEKTYFFRLVLNKMSKSRPSENRKKKCIDTGLAKYSLQTHRHLYCRHVKSKGTFVHRRITTCDVKQGFGSPPWVAVCGNMPHLACRRTVSECFSFKA